MPKGNKHPLYRGGPRKLIGVRMDASMIANIDEIIANPDNRVPRTRQGLIRGVMRQWIRENHQAN